MQSAPDVSELSRQAAEKLNAQDFEGAALLYERALAHDANRADDWVNLGLAEAGRNHLGAAVACFDRALALHPDHALAWFNRGNALDAAGRREEVLECYDRALEINPQLARCWFNKGDEMGKAGRFIEAKACFENARDLGTAQGDEPVAREAAVMVRRCDDVLMNESYA